MLNDALKNNIKTVVVLGKGRLCLDIANYFHNSPAYKLIATVPNFPDSEWAPSLAQWSRENGVSYVSTGRVTDLISGSNERPVADLVVSVTYDKILTENVIRSFTKAINIHNGPLPQYRGVNPINWALKNNETNHGVTIHEITPGIDDGPIINSIAFPIDPKVDEVRDVYERCMIYGWKLFQSTIPKLWEIKPEPQNEQLAQYYSKKDFHKLAERRFFTREESQ